ncbi:MAG: hypothetical protein ACE5FY_01315 [Nitrospiria bacterium]
MSGDVRQALTDVVKSMEGINRLFEEKLGHLKQAGSDEDDLLGLEKGVLAMKDSGRLYITWTEYFIEKLNEVEGLGPLE